MYSLSICFGPQGTVWNFLFKTTPKEFKPDTNGDIFVTDDFGQAGIFNDKQIHGFLVEDLEQSQLGQIERGLHQARSQARAQTRAMEDPIIKESIRRQQMGPAVMSPVPGGRFNG